MDAHVKTSDDLSRISPWISKNSGKQMSKTRIYCQKLTRTCIRGLRLLCLLVAEREIIGAEGGGGEPGLVEEVADGVVGPAVADGKRLPAELLFLRNLGTLSYWIPIIPPPAGGGGRGLERETPGYRPAGGFKLTGVPQFLDSSLPRYCFFGKKVPVSPTL